MLAEKAETILTAGSSAASRNSLLTPRVAYAIFPCGR